MITKVFTVKDVFLIPGRGLVLTSDIAMEDRPAAIRVGAELQLRRPGLGPLNVVVRGFEVFSPASPGRPLIMLAGEPTLEEKDVPVGTEAWHET